jgi:hypothetical protein
LLDRGWRPALRERLRAEERRLCLRRERVPWTNWGGTAACTAAVSWLPETTEDVVAIVRECRARGGSLRMVASGFSWPRLVPTDDTLVFTERLDSLALDTTDPTRPLLVAGAGATNRQINTFLAPHGLALPWNVVLETVRIGGTVSTGTHGSGRDTATMGDLLEAVELVDATGALRRFTPADGDVFDALRLSFGSFGVVTRVWLRLRPMTAMRQVDRKVPLDEALAKLEAYTREHDAVELYWFPFTDWVWLRTLDQTDAAVTHRPLSSWAVKAQHYVQMWGLRQGTRLCARRWPRGLPAWIRFSTRWLRFGEAVVPLPDAVHYRQWIESMRVGCVEAAVPMAPGFEGARLAFAQLRARTEAWAARGQYPMNLAVNVRFIGESRALLSPAFGEPLTMWIEALCQGRSEGWEAFSGELLADWLSLPGALPHWAKELAQLPGGLPRLRDLAGPRLGRFVAARQRAGVDPEGMFLNPLLRTLLKPARACGAADRPFGMAEQYSSDHPDGPGAQAR